MPARFQVLSWLSFAAQQMLLPPDDVEVVHNGKVFDLAAVHEIARTSSCATLLTQRAAPSE